MAGNSGGAILGRDAAEVAAADAMAHGCVVPVDCRCEGVGDRACVVVSGESVWVVLVNLASAVLWFVGGALLAWWLHRRGLVGPVTAALIASGLVGFGLMVGLMMVYSRGVRRRLGARLGRVLFVDRGDGIRLVLSDACGVRAGVSGARLVVFEGRVSGGGGRYGVGVIVGTDGVAAPVGLWTRRSVGHAARAFAGQVGLGFERRAMPADLVLDRTTMQTILLEALRLGGR